MSDFLQDGATPRQYKTARICLSVANVQRYEGLDSPDKPTLSHLLNDLLNTWLLDEELKSFFKRIG